MVKRIVDILLSLVFGILSLPVCLIIALAIKLDDSKNIIFYSERIGFGGKKFKMYKFRTMKADLRNNLSDEQLKLFHENFKLIKDQRVTRVGFWLRRFSLDEIPQFINVLKGDMSIIGPRPKLPEEIELFGEKKDELLSVLPGITGYWQVYRRNANSDENMRKLDLYYVNNKNLILDLKLLLMTFFMVFSKKNY